MTDWDWPMVGTEVVTTPGVGGAGVLRQLYPTTLLDLGGDRAIEWAYVPADLLAWSEPDMGVVLEALELEEVVRLSSLSALPAAIVAMLESGTDEFRGRLDELLDADLRIWAEAVDPGTLAFAQFAAFSAVIPVEWSPLHKVPVGDAALVKASATGITAAGTVGLHLAVAAGAHGAVIVAVGLGGVVVGAVVAPLGVVIASALSLRLVRRRLQQQP